MTLAARLRQIADALPPAGAVTFSRSDLVELLELDAAPDAAAGADLTVEAVADRLDRAVSTVRTWCADGLLIGAYRLRGREWRIPATALSAFQRDEAARFRSAPTSTSRSARAADTSTWEKHMAAQS